MVLGGLYTNFETFMAIEACDRLGEADAASPGLALSRVSTPQTGVSITIDSLRKGRRASYFNFVCVGWLMRASTICSGLAP
jgi:hypothetical protein